jgi:co-chaperonin GroES (HSP10)
MGPPRDALDEDAPVLAEAKFDWSPLYDKILVRREKPKETYDAGGRLVVAETHQHAQNRGTVIATGPGRLNPNYGTKIPLDVLVGMEVMFGKHSGVDMEDAPDLVLLREDELLAYRMPPRD